MNRQGKPLEFAQQKELRILNELSSDDSLTQRDLSSRLGIALGLVNSYIKNLMAKGYITVKSIPPKRYAYFLTPKGLAEKTRLTYDLLLDYTRIYRETRENLKNLFHELHNKGVRNIVFAGVDEVAEIAYITLQETDIKLVGVVDDIRAGKDFFKSTIRPMADLGEMENDCIIVTSYLRREKIYRELLKHGVDKRGVKVIFEVGSK